MKNYICEPCQYETKYKQDLNKHVKTKHHLLKVNGKSWEKKTHTCKKCEYVTQYKSDLDKHIKRVHNNKINVKYLCLACCEYIETTRDHDAHLANKTHRKNVITNMSHHGEFYKLNNINNMANVYKEPLFIKNVNLTINKKDINKVDKKTIDKYEKENSLLTDEILLKMYNKRTFNNFKELIIKEYGSYLNKEERNKVNAENEKNKVKLEDDSEEEISIKKYKVNKVVAKALDQIFMLHADHEQNASTSTVRTAGSSGANPFACISAGIASLWGPAHGGANEAVIKMLKEIGSVDKIPEFIKRVKNKEEGVRLMGFGHRVYKNYDPRAAVLKKACEEVLEELGQKNNPLLKIAMELERIALSDQYFIERKLYPNVDFYSGIIYQAMGIPYQMFTVLFAVARTVGWMSQWKEMLEDKDQKISRPRQLYVGEVSRKI